MVKCESLLTINKSMVVKVLGTVSESGIRKVNVCLFRRAGIRVGKKGTDGLYRRLYEEQFNNKYLIV